MVRVGGFEPGTIALGVLSAVTGVSGYGASVVNKDQQKVVDEKVAQEVSNIKGSVDELNTIKESLAAETSEKEQLKSEVEALKNAIEQLKMEKSSKEGQIKTVQVEEYAYRSAPRERLMRAFEILAEKLPKSPETDDAIKKLSKDTSSMITRRGTLNDTVMALASASGKQPEEVRGLIKDALREAQVAHTPGTAPVPVPEPTAPVPEPTAPTPEPAEPDAETQPEPTQEKDERDAECKAVLDGVGITSRRQFLKWSKTNHPDKGGDTAIYQRVNECVLRLFPNGGLRKKKLRTRRGGKQNVGRSRSRKDRSNRTH